MKTLADISWLVSEEEYRADPALSYSTLAKFAREGFNKIDTLFDKVESPSLTFGSAVDSIITGGMQEFEERFLVADFPAISDSVLKMVKESFNRCSQNYRDLNDIPTQIIIDISEELKYQLNWKPETRAKVVKEQGAEYYSLMYIAQNKTILDTITYEKVLAAVDALRNSPATATYFANDDIVERQYQLKFKHTFDGIDYKCMMDLAIIDHNNKIIHPVDLKTSSHTEWDFPDSFITWCYAIQARLYWNILRANMDKDEYFKDFELDDYRFIVVNKNTLTPLVWKFEDTKKYGKLTYGKNNQIEIPDPFELGRQLSIYLSSRPRVPEGINIDSDNSITKWLNNK